MKIHELPVGAEFEYQGQRFVKTGPQVADGPDGRRLVPRHATLRPLGASASLATARDDYGVPYAALLDAFERFHARCLPCIASGAEPAFEEAREDFLRTLAGLRAPR